MRFAAIAFAGLSLELARQRLVLSKEAAPFAVVVSRRGGAVKDETSLLGNTRLTAVSPEAIALGVRPGQTLAAAKAKYAPLRVRVVPEADVEAALVTVAEMALAFGATTSFAADEAGDVVWVDITGCAHLHASDADPEGERTLAAALTGEVSAMGHACRVAIADGPTVAAAVARFGRAAVQCEGRGGSLIVPVHENARAMGQLPLASLALSPDALGWLSKVGVRRVSDLQRLREQSGPGLAARLGPEAARVMALLEGDDRAPLRPHVPLDRPFERVVLEYGVTHHEALLFVVKRLTDRLAARLDGRVKKARKLLLRLEVDDAVAGAPKEDPTLAITLASPLARADELFAVVRAKLLSPDASLQLASLGQKPHEEDGTMDVPILAMSIEVTEEVAAESVPQHLFVPEAKAERALPRLVAELSAELGPAAVGVLALVDTWVTAERSRLVPYRASPPSSLASLVSEGEEMTRLLPVPKKVPRSQLATMAELRLVARSEQVEWWKGESAGGATDAFVAFFSDEKAKGTAWVTVEARTGDAFIQGWLD